LNQVTKIARDLISQYGDDAESIAMLRAAEYAANLNHSEWKIWEEVLRMVIDLQNANHLDS
tara:strand:+ start:773 stop:955 length:183 start_codon:yes stop_codon:yes gene_type:complete